MSDPGLLSQSEIDMLLASIAAEGEIKEPVTSADAPVPDNIKRYDFRRPDRFSKEQMRALRMIHETWARRIAVSLSAHLRTSIEAGLSDIDQGMYTTLSQQLPDRGLYYIIGLFPLGGHFVLYLNTELAMMFADRLLGGPGVAFKAERRLTDLEVDLLQGVAEKLLVDLQEAWASVFNIRPRIEDVSLNLLLMPVALPTDAIVWASFEVRIRGNASGMVLALPYPALKPIAGELSPYTWASNPASADGTGDNRLRRDLENCLGSTKLPVSVVLGSTRLNLEELTSLQPGDVLPLNAPTDGFCSVLVSGQRKFVGSPGLRGRRMALQITASADDPSFGDLYEGHSD